MARLLDRVGRNYKRLRVRLAHLHAGATPYRYVFHHIPKCAGTSSREAFSHWFIEIDDYPRNWATGTEVDDFGEPVDLRRLRAHQMLSGHFHLSGTYLEERYPECISDPHYRLITFVRDPLEIQISLFNFERQNGRLPPDATLEHQIMERSNYLSERLPCTRDDYQQVLDRYFFIGRSDQLQRSFDLLAARTRFQPVKVTTRNSIQRHNRPLSADLVEEFRTRNALDYLVYEEALRRFES